MECYPDPNRWLAVDHVQLAMPAGREDAARAFYHGVLGMDEEPKPPVLAARGGCWFVAGSTDRPRVRVHLGVEQDFRPAQKAHPGLVVRGLRDFVTRAGLDVRWTDEIVGVDRCYVDDPFGNRIELIDGTG
jgi:catechol 2,3-dioxygenase-like lactoylglutathione lyase family enzyme